PVGFGESCTDDSRGARLAFLCRPKATAATRGCPTGVYSFPGTRPASPRSRRRGSDPRRGARPLTASGLAHETRGVEFRDRSDAISPRLDAFREDAREARRVRDSPPPVTAPRVRGKLSAERGGGTGVSSPRARRAAQGPQRRFDPARAFEGWPQARRPCAEGVEVLSIDSRSRFGKSLEGGRVERAARVLAGGRRLARIRNGLGASRSLRIRCDLQQRSREGTL